MELIKSCMNDFKTYVECTTNTMYIKNRENMCEAYETLHETNDTKLCALGTEHLYQPM